MIRQGMEFWVNNDFRRRAYDVMVIHHTPSYPKPTVGLPLVFGDQVDEAAVVRPTMSLSPEEASALMTELWKAGVRPMEVGTTGELQSVKYHLEDMRRLVFNDTEKKA